MMMTLASFLQMIDELMKKPIKSHKERIVVSKIRIKIKMRVKLKDMSL